MAVLRHVHPVLRLFWAPWKTAGATSGFVEWGKQSGALGNGSVRWLSTGRYSSALSIFSFSCLQDYVDLLWPGLPSAHWIGAYGVFSLDPTQRADDTDAGPQPCIGMHHKALITWHVMAWCVMSASQCAGSGRGSTMCRQH